MIVINDGRRPGRVRDLVSGFAFILALLCVPAGAQTLSLLSAPPGYDAGSIDLGAPFGGGLGAHPADPDIIYVATGYFGAMSLARIDLSSETVTQTAAGPFGAIAGIAAISSTEIVIIDNDGAAGGPPDDTILIARDNNPQDGDFDDPGEITELLAPIFTGTDFTGTQARLVPPGDPSGIPSGSVMYQSADGGGISGLYVITDPLTAPAYRPTGAAYYSPFDFNGGFDFSSAGHIYMGTLNAMSFAGEVYGLVNTNADEDIDAGESNLVAGGESGISDLVIDGEDDVFFASANASFQGTIRTFPADADPLSQSAVTSEFAVTSAGFLSGIILNSRALPFEPETGPGGAVLLLSGFTPSFAAATNLLTLTPSILQPSPTASPSVTPGPSPTPGASPTASASPTATATSSPSAVPTGTIGLTPPPSPTPEPSTTPTPSASPTPTSTGSPEITPSPSRTATPTPSATATPSPSPMPTNTGSPEITPSPSRTTTPTPSATPTPTPVLTPTPAPCCPGDADNSGSFVDAGDFIAVQANFGADHEVGGLGDANCSGGFVDAFDFIAVQANFGADCG